MALRFCPAGSAAKNNSEIEPRVRASLLMKVHWSPSTKYKMSVVDATEPSFLLMKILTRMHPTMVSFLLSAVNRLRYDLKRLQYVIPSFAISEGAVQQIAAPVSPMVSQVSFLMHCGFLYM